MGTNLCEYIQMLDVQHLIRHLLRLANSQTHCSNNDCITNDGLNNDLRQLEDSTIAGSITIGYFLFTFFILLMVLPNPNQIIRRITPNRSNNKNRFDQDRDHSNDEPDDLAS